MGTGLGVLCQTIAGRVKTSDGVVGSEMHRHHHLRRPIRSNLFLVQALMILTVISVALTVSACGLFGGDDEETPDVVPPPATSAQAGGSDATSPAVSDDPDEQPQQADAPTEAVQVTTSPTDDEEQDASRADTEEQLEEESDRPVTYTVQEGDTLANIASSLDVRIDDLITLNGIQNPDLLRVGQVLQIPQPEPIRPPNVTSADDDEDDAAAAQSDPANDADDDAETLSPPVELPTQAIAAATPTRVSHLQFPQPSSDVTTDRIPDPPNNFLQYGAEALPWLHGVSEIDTVIELLKAWPMPPLAIGHDRISLIDLDGDGNFSLALIYTDPNSFGSAVPFSNLVVYDPVPGNPSKYRIGYDHALAYAREVQGIQQLTDLDLTGDTVRDLVFREISCDAARCVSSFYVLATTETGYHTVTGSAARIAEVSAVEIEDRTGDGVPELVVQGQAVNDPSGASATFILTARGNELVEVLRVSASAQPTPQPTVQTAVQASDEVQDEPAQQRTEQQQTADDEADSEAGSELPAEAEDPETDDLDSDASDTDDSLEQ